MLWFCVVFVVFDHNCRGCRGSLSCQETHDGQVLLRCECGTYGCSSCSSSSSSSSLYSSSSSSSCQRAIRVVSRTLGILCTGRVRLYIVIYIYTHIFVISPEKRELHSLATIPRNQRPPAVCATIMCHLMAHKLHIPDILPDI